jgi:hypothetical protein
MEEVLDNDFSTLTFFKEASGAVVGIVGVNQVKNEFNSIIGSLKSFHAGQEAK